MKQENIPVVTHPTDFERLGFETMLETRDFERTREICALEIHSYADSLAPVMGSLRSGIEQTKAKAMALQAFLYDRAVPVVDAAMLSRSFRIRLFVALIALAAIASLVGNMTTFYLFGFELFAVALLALGATALPVVVGHLAYERLIVRHEWLQGVVLIVAVALCFGALYRMGEARRLMVEKTTAPQSSASYVEDDAAEAPTAQPTQDDGGESKVRGTLSGGVLLMLFAADLVLGFLFGAISHMQSDVNYAAWRKLKELASMMDNLKERLGECTSAIEIAKKRCTAGILRAQSSFQKRSAPYYRILTLLALAVLVAIRPAVAQSDRGGERPPATQNLEVHQAFEQLEGILIDTSGSIERSGGPHNELFNEYLLATKKLLLSEPPNARVWVSVISTDSFGDAPEILKGWTPEAHGVFTDDLNRARDQLAASFEAKSSRIPPLDGGTDIFGALWRMKTAFQPQAPQKTAKVIWIFSDMVNETGSFAIPDILDMGPEQMFSEARSKGLIVPLKGYKIHVYGASTKGLTPQSWMIIKRFWQMYFAGAGAELVTYSVDCEVSR